MHKICNEILAKLQNEGKVKRAGYEFPETIPLTKRLKDILEKNVDEKYYLSDERIAKIKLWDARQRENGNGFRFETKTGEDISRTVTTGDDRPAETTYIEDRPVRLGGMYDNEKGRHQAGSIYAEHGVSPTLDTCSGGNRMPYVGEPKVVEDFYQSREARVYEETAPTLRSDRVGLKVAEPYIVASRGRGEKGNTAQHFEPRYDGVSNTITSVQKDSMVVEPQAIKRRRTEYGKQVRKAYENHEIEADEAMRENYAGDDGVMPTVTVSKREQKIVEPVCLTPNNYSHKAGDGMATRKRTVSEISGTIAAKPGGNGEMLVGEPVMAIKTANAQGYDIAKDGDGIDLSYPQSTTRRGRVGHGVSKTIMTADSNGVAIKNLKEQPCDKLVESGTVQGGEIVNHSYTTSEQRKELGDYIETKDGTSPTLTTRPDILGYVENPPLRIRKLTSLETWRLQGFDDIAHNRAEQAGVSQSQRYKQAGNSVTVNVICALLSQLGLGEKKWNEMTIAEREQLAEAKML